MHLLLFYHIFLDVFAVVFGEGFIEFEYVFVEGDLLFEEDGDNEGILDKVVLYGVDHEVATFIFFGIFLNHILILTLIFN